MTKLHKFLHINWQNKILRSNYILRRESFQIMQYKTFWYHNLIRSHDPNNQARISCNGHPRQLKSVSLPMTCHIGVPHRQLRIIYSSLRFNQCDLHRKNNRKHVIMNFHGICATYSDVINQTKLSSGWEFHNFSIIFY